MTAKRPCQREHPDPRAAEATCKNCWRAVHVRCWQRAWGLPDNGEHEHSPERVGPRVKATSSARVALPCVHRGGTTAPPDRLPTSKTWYACEHPDKPLGDPVCACKGCGPSCRGYEADEPEPPAGAAEVCLPVSADGIGDHLMALAVAARWKRDHPDRELVLAGKSWCLDWLRLFEGHDRLATDPPAGAPLVHDLARHGDRQYVEAAAERPRLLPWPRPLSTEARAFAEPFAGAVALAPWGLSRSRWWPLPYWLQLERMLLDTGRRCVILDGRAGEDRDRNRAFRSPVLADESPERVAAVMSVSAGAVANESGMAHLAGTLRVPAVVLYAQLDAAPIYAGYPTVRLVRGPLGCSGCRWTGPEFRSRCNTVCASLAAIPPADVFRALGEVAAPPPGLVPDPAADRALAALLAAVDGRPWHEGRCRGLGRALVHLNRVDHPRVVETGCQRADDDTGAGMATTIFGRYLAAVGGRLTSVDLDPGHVAFARSRTRGLPVEVVLSDSRDFFRTYAGAAIDLLYLDSMDTYVPGFAECSLEEAQLALPHLAPGGAVLVDDTWRGGGGGWNGKGEKAVPWLIEQGLRVVWAGYQVLLTRG